MENQRTQSGYQQEKYQIEGKEGDRELMVAERREGPERDGNKCRRMSK